MLTAGEEPAGLKGYFGMTVVVKEQGLGPGQGLAHGQGQGLGQGVESVRVLTAADWGNILSMWSRR